MEQSNNWYRIIVIIMTVVIAFGIATSMAFAANGDSLNASLHPQDGSTPTIEPFLQTDLQIITGNVQRPNGIFWHDGFLYTGCAGDFTIYRLDDTTGTTITYISGVQNTHSMYVEDGPVLWAADFQRSTLSRIDTSQSPARVDIAEGLASPWGLAAADDDSFYLTQLRADDVINITREGDIRTIATGFRNPTGIIVDDDFVYVANNGSARRAIEWFEVPDDAILTADDMQPLVSGLQNTTNLVMGPDGLLYFAYSLGTRGIVGRVDAEHCRDQGGCTNVDVEIVLWSELAAPLAGLSISPDMRLFVHTMFGSEIYWLQLPAATLPTDTPTDVPQDAAE